MNFLPGNYVLNLSIRNLFLFFYDVMFGLCSVICLCLLLISLLHLAGNPFVE